MSVDLGVENKVVLSQPASVRSEEWSQFQEVTGAEKRTWISKPVHLKDLELELLVNDNEMQKIIFQWTKETKFQNLCQLKPGWVRNRETNEIMTLRDELEDLKTNGFPEEGWVGTVDMAAMCSQQRTRIRKKFQIILQGNYRPDHENHWPLTSGNAQGSIKIQLQLKNSSTPTVMSSKLLHLQDAGVYHKPVTQPWAVLSTSTTVVIFN